MTPPRRSRFTLVELVIVIAVILIVISVFLGVLTHSREKARRVACQGNLITIGRALRMYADDWQECFPLSSDNNFQPLVDLSYLGPGLHYGCPSSFYYGKASALDSDYLYLGSGRRLNDPTPGLTSAAYDLSGNHPNNSWINVLFLDGHVNGHPVGDNGEFN